MRTKTSLAVYLTKTGRSQGDLARAVHAHRSQITRLVSGERGASGPLAAAIEKETRGAVPASSLWRPRSRAA